MRQFVLFDFDGTLVNNSRGIWNCINYATDKMSLPRATPAVLQSFIGPSLFDSFCAHFENDPARAELFIRCYRERYSVRGKYEGELYPGIGALLRALRDDGFRLAVCSSKPLEFVTDIAKHFHIIEDFDFLSCPSFQDNVSDKTALANACLSYFGAEKADAILVGDRIFDIDAANGAGVASVGVTYGFAPAGELEAAGADYLANDVEALGALLRVWREKGIEGDG